MDGCRKSLRTPSASGASLTQREAMLRALGTPISRTLSCPVEDVLGKKVSFSSLDSACRFPLDETESSENESGADSPYGAPYGLDFTGTTAINRAGSQSQIQTTRRNSGRGRLYADDAAAYAGDTKPPIVVPRLEMARLQREVAGASFLGNHHSNHLEKGKRSRSRFSWSSAIAAEGATQISSPQDTLPEREMSEDSGLESGVESARDGAGGKKHAKKNPERRRSLQVYTATLSFSGDVNIKAKALRRSKETEDIMTISTKSKQSTKKELKEMLKLEKKKKKNKRKKLQLKNNSNSNSNSSNNKKKQGGKDIDQDEEEEDSLSSSSSAACSPHRQNQPVIMRRRLMLNAEGSGVSVQCLLLVGDNVWAADSVGRITVFNAKGDTEKVIQASSERLYSMVLVDKKHVWVAGKDRVIRVFNASKYKKEKELLSHQAMVRCLQVIEHPERGNQVWSADVAGRIIIWDPQMKKEGEIIVQEGEAIFCMISLPHCVWVAAGGEIYRLNSRKLKVETGWRAHDRPISDLIYLKQDDVVLSCATDGIIREWKDHRTQNHSSLLSEASLRPASLLREITSMTNVSFFSPTSPRSNLRVCAGHTDGTISFLDSDMNEVAQVKSDGSEFGWIRYMLNTLPEDGKTSRKLKDSLWSAHRDGSIIVWDWAVAQ